MMNPFAGGLLGLLFLNAAVLSPWLAGELYFRRGPVVHLVLALAANGAVVAAAGFALRRIAGEQIALKVVRFVILAVVLHVVLGLAAGSLQLAVPGPARMAIAACLAIVAVQMMAPALAGRLVRAIGLAAIAFALVPTIWRAAVAPDIRWEPVAASGGTSVAKNKIILLLDELGDTAASPIADALRQAGLQVAAQSLKPAGENTLNVIPTMFSGKNFDQARPCGRSSICSDAHVLDFSRITAARPDVDVIGLQHPYCDIAGLRSCHAVDLPHEHENAYRSLASLYFARLRIPGMKGTARRPDTAPQRRIVQDQLDALDAAPFWTHGGVLYAHLALPHPPGHDRLQPLDADYQDNIAQATAVVKQLVARLRGSFGNDFALLVVSDHPLRKYWCTSPYYLGTDCAVRPAYDTARVPFIVASPRELRPIEIDTNRDVFGKL